MGALDGGVWLDAVQHESLMTSYKCRQQDMISWPMVRQQVRHRRRIGTSLSCMSAPHPFGSGGARDHFRSQMLNHPDPICH